MIVSVEQLEKLIKLKLKKKQDMEYLEINSVSLETKYGRQIIEILKIAAIWSLMVVSIQTQFAAKNDGNLTIADLIQEMVESFGIYGKVELDTSDSDSKYEVISTVTVFKSDCNLCGKARHNAKDCPQHHKIKCKHCSWCGHKKETCWKLEEQEQEGGVVS